MKYLKFKPSVLLITLIFISINSCKFFKNEYKIGKNVTFNKLFDHDYLHEIELIFKKKEWENFLNDLKVNKRSGKYRKALFIYKGPYKEEIIEEIGFRTRGNTTREIPQDENGIFKKAHFNIKFNECFDMTSGSSEYNKRNDRRFHKLRKLILRYRDKDDTQIREMYCYDLMNRMGVNSPKTGSTRLTITIGNKKHYYGIYTMIEPIDKSFLTKRYGKNNNDYNLYKCGPRATLELGSFKNKKNIGIKDWVKNYRPRYDLKTNTDNPNYNDLIDFIEKVNNLNGDEFKEYIDNNFEVDKLLKYMAVNIYLGNWDAFRANGKNYYLYFNKKSKIELYPFDFDKALGKFWKDSYKKADIYNWINRCKEDTGRDYSHPLPEKILQIKEYRKKYEEYLEYLINPQNELFIYTDFKKRFYKLKALYSPYLATEMKQDEKMRLGYYIENYFYERTNLVVEQLGLNKKEYQVISNSLLYYLKKYLRKYIKKDI
jgi:spore coat protein CotH